MKISIVAMFLLELVLAGAAQNNTGAVTGQIRTLDGAPASGVRVAALAAGSTSAESALLGLAETDGNGRYRLESIPNGRYYIVAGPVETPLYHPGVENATAATIVTIAGAVVGGVDFSVNLARVMAPRDRGPAVAFQTSQACRNGPAPVSPPSQTVTAGDFVQFERTQCFGVCPQYTARLLANGDVFWNGGANVATSGIVTARVDAGKARNLIEQYRTSAFWSLCNNFSSSDDSPLLIATVRIGATERRVTMWDSRAQDWASKLIDETEKLADTHRWIHGDPRTELLTRVSGENGGKPGMTALMLAARSANTGEIQRLLAANADVDARDSSGWTALIYAAAAGSPSGPAALKMLLDAGADANARSFMDQTPLMSAARAFDSPIARITLLIAAAADVNAQDKNGRTVLMHVAKDSLTNERMYQQKIELCSVLLAAGARTDLRDSDGLTVLDLIDKELSPFVAPQKPGETRWWNAEIIAAFAARLRQTLRN